MCIRDSIIGLGLGIALTKARVPLWLATVVALPLVGAAIAWGPSFPLAFPGTGWIRPQLAWNFIILGYCFVASLIPVSYTHLDVYKRQARTEGPQRVSHHGKETVVLMAEEDYLSLHHRQGRRGSLVDFFAHSPLAKTKIELGRSKDQDLSLIHI